MIYRISLFEAENIFFYSQKNIVTYFLRKRFCLVLKKFFRRVYAHLINTNKKVMLINKLLLGFKLIGCESSSLFSIKHIR